MKRILCLMLAAALLCLPGSAMAVDSRGNSTIPETGITDIVPKDPSQGIPPAPTVNIGGGSPDIDKLREDLQTTYRLTIYYIYPDGTPAADPYSSPMDAGTEYGVRSPEVPSYTPSAETVRGVMPKRDTEYTVLYLPGVETGGQWPEGTNIPFIPEEFFTIDDYGTPLGIGFTIMHVGICME